MKKHSGCDYESAVVQSLKSGFKSEEFTAHIESCQDCHETAKIVRFSNKFAGQITAQKSSGRWICLVEI